MSALPELNNEEILRYSRHLILPEVGLEGQRKLKGAKVLMVGGGGLGAPLGLYLAAVGVGKIGIVDFDKPTGRFLHLGFRGIARPHPWDADTAIALLSKYLGSDRAGWDPRFADAPESRTNVFVRFTPRSFVARDQSFQVGG